MSQKIVTELLKELEDLAESKEAPFDIKLEKFLKMDFKQRASMQETVYKRFINSLSDSWRRGNKIAIITDGKIFYETKDEIIPDEIIQRLRKLNRAYYAFTAPDKIEESVWMPTATPPINVTVPLKNDKEPYEESCMLLASYFRDAINYGYLKAKCEKEQSERE